LSGLAGFGQPDFFFGLCNQSADATQARLQLQKSSVGSGKPVTYWPVANQDPSWSPRKIPKSEKIGRALRPYGL